MTEPQRRDEQDNREPRIAAAAAMVASIEEVVTMLADDQQTARERLTVARASRRVRSAAPARTMSSELPQRSPELA
jgi:hypothetical protein